MFSALFYMYLSDLHDNTFYGEIANSAMPFSLTDLVEIIAELKETSVSLHMVIPPYDANHHCTDMTFEKYQELVEVIRTNALYMYF